MPLSPINDGSEEYYRLSGSTASDNRFFPVGSYYSGEFIDWDPPKKVKYKNAEGKEEEVEGIKKYATPSIFNRYSIFFFNSRESGGKGPSKPEDYMDGVNFSDLGDPAGGTGGGRSVHNRRKLEPDALNAERNPTASNIIKWSKSGGNNAIDYAWEDFLWCKNYGMIPNNYMITLRRFPIPVMDDLSDNIKNPAPDIGRMITWVDGETNKWDTVGLKWSHGLTWKKLESEIQTLNSPEKAGNEGAAFGGMVGNIIKAASWATQPGSDQAALSNPNASTFDPYSNNSNTVWGPVDVIKEMFIREKGLVFDQQFTLTFEYELRSIDGINPKIAMIDLLSNVLICTMNRGSFWGGDVRFYGGNPRQIKPLGDTSKLAKGDYGGYISSLATNIVGRLDKLTGGAGISLEGIGNAAKNLGSSVLANIVGGGLDNMGRPGIVGINSLLTGEDTGEWHVTVGNPANPIISVGNLVLDKTEIELGGPLGTDDFTSKLTVICTLKPARPRERTDIIAMFHKNGRTYLTNPPSATKFSGNVPNVRQGKNGGKITTGPDKASAFNINNVRTDIGSNLLSLRFPNHTKESGILTESAKATT